MDGNLDLFGQPLRPGYGSRGRPAYEATDRDRNKVKLLLALGWSISRIANGINVSPATVKRYFRAELKKRDAMRDQMEARRFEIVMEQANTGNVAALKLLALMLERNDRMEIEREMASSQPPETAAAERPGKKVIDERRAMDADADLMRELEVEATNARLHS